MGTSKKPISILIILLISILFGYQNCGNFKSYGNGDPYEGLITIDNNQEIGDNPNGGVVPVQGNNNVAHHCIADDKNGHISNVTIIYDALNNTSRLLIDVKNDNGIIDVDLEFDVIPGNQWDIDQDITPDIFAISFTNEANSPSIFTLRYMENPEDQEFFTCTQVL